jgi:hypothetical protein
MSSNSSPFFGSAIKVPFIFSPNSDNFINWTIVLGSNQTPVLDAEGSATLYDEYGQPVPGATNIPMEVSGTTGLYVGQISRSGFSPSPGRNYKTKITLTSSGANLGKTWGVESWVVEEGIA